MSGSTKIWIGDTMYLVDDEVFEFFEKLQLDLIAVEKERDELKENMDFMISEATNLLTEQLTALTEERDKLKRKPVCEYCGEHFPPQATHRCPPCRCPTCSDNHIAGLVAQLAELKEQLTLANEKAGRLEGLLRDALPHIECETSSQSGLITEIGEALKETGK